MLAGCAPKSDYVVVDGFALGTTYHFVVGGIADTAGMRARIASLLGEVEASMSIYDSNSLISRLNRNETDSVDRHIAYCVEQARMVSEMSGGVYDVTILPLTEAWGFAGVKAAAEPDVDSLLRFVGYEKIRVEDGRLIKERPEVRIDLNSIAKGYAVDLMAGLMEEFGSENYLVEIGGEIFCRGINRAGRDWLVGIDSPSDGNYAPGADVQTELSLSGAGLATSGNYRKFYVDGQGRKVVHTIDAVTGGSRPSNLLSATVVAHNTTVADALGTMMMALGLEKSVEFLERNHQFAGYLIYADDDGNYKEYVSPAMHRYMGRRVE